MNYAWIGLICLGLIFIQGDDGKFKTNPPIQVFFVTLLCIEKS